MPEGPSFIEAPDVKELVESLLVEDATLEHPKFSHIDVSKIRFLTKVGNSKGFVAKVKSYGEEEYLANSNTVKYVITINQGKYDPLAVDIKKKVLTHELLHIPVDFLHGKLYRHDVQDFSFMIREYGIDWLTTIPETNDTTQETASEE